MMFRRKEKQPAPEFDATGLDPETLERVADYLDARRRLIGAEWLRMQAEKIRIRA